VLILCISFFVYIIVYVYVYLVVFVFTARCTLVQSAVLQSHVVCQSVRLSVCDVRW